MGTARKRLYRTGIALMIAASIVVLIAYQPPLDRKDLQRYIAPTSEFLELGGASVHYRREGNTDGPLLLLLHGTASSLHTWDGWVDALGDDYNIVRVDLPGFGLTGAREDRDYSAARYVQFVDQFAEALDIDDFALIGNSLGGNIAWQYALSHPGDLTALVLIDPSGFVDESKPPPLAFRLANTPLLHHVVPWFAPRSLYESSIYDVYGDDSLVTEELIERYYQLSLYGGNRQAFVDKARQFSKTPVERLPEITTPTLILWGEEDTWIPVADATRFANAIPNSQVITYPGVGHVPMEEIPARTAADTEQFLQQVLR
ncbi:MAG: alpha/beta hydrolase [Pseudomonadota bacterium]